MNSLRRFICTLLIAVMAISSITGCSVLEEESNATLSVTDENKLEVLESLGITLHNLELVKGEVPKKETTSENKTEIVNYEMPDISEYEPFVTGSGEVEVEIFLPTEENGSSIQELMKYLGESFNNSEFKTEDGKTESVTIRSLESALAEDFIESGAYIPNGYIAANELYGALMESYGIESNMICNKLVGNTMGLAIIREKFDELFSDSKQITSKDIVEANLEGKLKIGYPNPINSPTGLNFVVSMLSGLDEANPNSIEATTDFNEFQGKANVFYSTNQMLKAAEKGEINAFVMEHQAFDSTEMDDKYVFIPFGMRHDYPLYEMSNNTDEQNEVLLKFVEFCQNENTYSTEMKFNEDSEYISTVSLNNYPVGTILEILDFWKKNKAGGKQIAAVFVADISGSMDYDNKRENLAKSLKDSMEYINEDAKVGLITYNHQVFNALPLGTFNQSQMEYFSGAADRVAKEQDGGTATNDALLMAIKMLYEEEQKNKEIKPIIILLSDGQQQSGYSLKKVKNIIKAFGYPIYTIGYGHGVDIDIKELQEIADINGGVYIDSSTSDVGYTIATLFKAEM